MTNIRESYDLSERHACRLLDHPRGTQRYVSQLRPDEDELTQAIIALAGNYGRYGYRRITALLRAAGWEVGTDRVQRIWRREGLKVPQKQKPRGRLWLNDGSCTRRRDAGTVRSIRRVDDQQRDGMIMVIIVLTPVTRTTVAFDRCFCPKI
ncbi:HTH-like domain-containing protein [Acidocella aminolytica 101 = DSM 11237]|nr:HTH-like domain-containing protein [Acidocella aminolytica 101 = DSM 11237]